MKIELVNRLVMFLSLFAAQVLILNHVHLFGVGTPLLYVYFAITFRRNFPKWLVLVSCFVLGLLIDIFSSTPGLAASAMTLVGLAQAFAVTPGVSRSGSTIATGLLTGVKRESMAQFSFLMVLIPIIGEQGLDLLKVALGSETFCAGVGVLPLALGFVAAFISGLFACKVMIALVKKAKLLWFALYCLLVASLILILA